MKQEVEKIFDDFLRKKLSSKPDVLKSILDDSRKNKALDECCNQIRIAELGKLDINVSRYKSLIEACAHLFADAWFEWKKQQIMSENEKKRIQAENTKEQEAKEVFEDMEKEAKEAEKPRVFIPNCL